MAEEPTHLIPLEEEIEGEREGTSDFVFCRIGESVPLKPSDSAFDPQNPPSQPLAVSERHRLLFLAHSEGFLVARTKDVIGIAKEIKEKGKGPCVEDSSVVDVKIGRVSILAISKDEMTVAATVGGEIFFFSVPSLLDKKQEPSFSCSLNNSGTIKDFKWQKKEEKSFVALSNHGSLYSGCLEVQLKDVMDNVDAVDWSVEGDFVAVARENTLRILSSKFKEQLSMSLLFQSWSTNTDSECPIKVDSIKWVRDDSIIIGCFRVNEDGNEEGYLVQVIKSREHKFSEISCKPVVFSFPDLFDGISDDILPVGGGPYLLASYLDCWELTLASNQKTIDQHILLLKWSMDDNRREVVFLEFNNDKYTPRIDLQENGDDNLILGLGVDKLSLYEKIKVQVDAEFKELSPYCVLLCLTSEGKLIMYHAARISEPSDLPQTSLSLDDHNCVKERLLTLSSSEGEVPTTTSSLKDDVQGATSDNRLKEISTEVPNTYKDTSEVRGEIISPEKKQEGDGLQLGRFTGQTASLNKSSAESLRIQGSGLALRNDVKLGIQMPNKSSAERGVSTTSSIGNIASEAAATWQASTKDTVKSGEAGKGVVGSISIGGAPFGSQSTRKPFGADGFNAKPSAFASNGSVVGDAQEKAKLNSFSSGIQSSVQLLSSKGSNSEPPSLIFSSNKATQNEGHTASWPRTGSAEFMPAIRGSTVLAQEGSLPGKSQYSRAQPLLENIRASKSRQVLESDPELSKQFYNVKDMAKELDTLLSFIEKEGGFRDVCTVSQKSSLLALENGLEDLSETSRICRKKVEERLVEIQQLQNKMSQVSAKQVYMKGIVEQASDGKYWDIWNQQKLSPEFEVKRQHILNANQNLTNQLIELDRHFNTLEINRFGESGRIRTDRRVFQHGLEPSRQIQSLHSVYNTLNSQLAAAEHLSECLSKQMAVLNINSPSVKRQNVAKELFESIGLSHETGAFQSPDFKRPGLTPDSIKRSSPSTINAIKEYRGKNTSSALKPFEPETARRRRDSLDRSWATFDPPKTTVKRIARDEYSRVRADKPFRKAKEAFDSKMEAFDTQLKSNATPASSSSQYPLNEGIQECPSKQVLEARSTSVFKWAKDISGSSQTLGSNSRPMQVMQRTTTQPSSSMAPSPSIFSSAHINTKEIFGSPGMSSIGGMRVGNQSNYSVAKTVPISKTISNMQFKTSAPTQTSSTVSGTISPMKTRPTAEAKGQASMNWNLKTEGDAQASSVPGSTKQLADSSESFSAITNESNISPLSSIPAVTSVDLNENTAKFNKVTTKNQSTESVSTLASQPKASASTPSFLPVSFSAFATSASASTALSLTSASLSSTFFRESSPGTKPAGVTNLTASVSTSTSAASSQSLLSSSTLLSSQSQNSLLPTTTPYLTPTSLPPMTFGGSLFNTKPVGETNQAASVSTSTSSASSQSLFSSAVVPASGGSLLLDKISSKSEPATLQAPATEEVVSEFKKEPSLLPTNSGSMFLAASNSHPEAPSSVTPPSSATAIEKDEGLDAILCQEDEMEEEAPDTTTVLNLGSLGGFGLGSTPPSSAPKPNPFGGSFLTSNSSTASSPLTLTSSPGESFRPASFSLPSAQPVQTSQPVNSGAFSGGLGGGFSGFGQPAQLGAGQQALGSVLGAFGQSRQLGGGMPGIGFPSSGGFNGGGFSPAANTGGFATAGGFTGAPMGGGFTSVASGGGGFAAAAKGGGFAAAASSGGGFAAAAAGGGFAAVAPGSGGFTAAAPTGGGFGGAGPGGGFASGGFGAFGSDQGGSFSAFGRNSAAGAGKPPAELLTQMRK